MGVVAEGRNIDPATVEGFGEEWDSFDQTGLTEAEWRVLFERYFAIFPWDRLPQGAEGFDLGCGSGRWAAGVVDRVGTLNCVDPSAKALAVCRRRLESQGNARFHHASVDAIPLADASQDFGYSLGVLHHIPDTAAAMADCVRKLKPGGAVPRLSLLQLRQSRSCLPHPLAGERPVAPRHLPAVRKGATSAIAALVYWPLARMALLLEKLGFHVERLPLAPYRRNSFYTMRTDALDRLGTRLEQRFSRAEVEAMMRAAGLEDIRFSEEVPYWTAVGFRAA